MDLLCTTVYNSWVTNMKSRQPTNVDVRQVTGVDLTNDTGVGSLYTHTPTNGTQTGLLEPSSMCVVVQNRIPSRYRGGHPRTYWPGMSTNILTNEYQWDAASLSAFLTSSVAFISTIVGTSFSGGTTTLQHVIPRYTYTYTNDSVHHKYTKQRTGYDGTFVVGSYYADQAVGSQRRRLKP
jgi:hypothetical protein